MSKLPCVVEVDKAIALPTALERTVALPIAISRAFAQLGESKAGILVIPAAWRPTVEIVAAIVAAIERAPALDQLVLVHPSAAMSFIASSLGIKLPLIAVRSATSLEDAFDDGPSTTSVLLMEPHETVEAFVHRGARELRSRAVRRGVLVLDAQATIGPALGDVLVDELLPVGTLRAIALVHPTANLEVPAASVRLRLPRAKIVTGGDVASVERALARL